MSDEPKKHSYTVYIPMAGHLVIDVEAGSKEEAKELAMNEATLDNLDAWEPMEQFNQGNVSYCPQPWAIDAQDNGEVEE